MIVKTRHIPDGKKHLKKLPRVHYLQAEYLYYPITSQRCPEGETCVIFGQSVKVGEQVGTRKGSFFEQPIHSTVSGEVVGYEKKMDSGGKLVDCLIVKNDFKYELHGSLQERTDREVEKLTKEEFIDIAKKSGLVGLGGSGFPTYIKLSTEHKIDTVLANGVECEPNLISDYEVMMEHPEEMIQGVIYTMRALSAKKGVIAIKQHYHELIERVQFTLKKFSDYDITVTPVGDYYPQGWENETIKTALNITVPQGKLPAVFGVMVFNVSTLQSIYHAVKYRLPVLERYFTLSGDGIDNRSFKARIGTSIQDLIDLDGGYVDPEIPKNLIVGGPMMGTNVTTDDLVMTHTTTSLIVQNSVNYDEDPCIHCAACVYSCPVSIQPVQIMNALKSGDKEFLKTLSVNKCIECGLCSYVCPSKIHLTEYMRQSKRAIR